VNQPTRDAASDSRFFFYYALALLGLVVIGFGPSFVRQLFTEGPPLSTHLHLHGAVLGGWFLLLALQSGLVRSHQVAMHRRLGRFVAGYGALVVVGGLLASLNWVSRVLATGASLDTDMGDINPLQGTGISYLDFAAGVIWINIVSLAGFVLLLFLAVVYRSQAAFHKRLVLLASVSIISPPIARIARSLVETEQGPFIPVAMLALLLAFPIHDFLTLRKVHPATVIGVVVVIASTALGGAIALSDVGKGFVRWLA
jgi:hypothetical protein